MAPTKWKRTYWAIFTANMVTAVGMMSFLPFFPSLVQEVGVEDREAIALWSGITFGAAPLMAGIMGPIWGSLGDRVGRKVMVLRALLAITLFVGLMGLARTPWELLGLRLAQGFFAGFVPPSITLVSIAAPKAVQGRVTGSLQASLAVGSIIGPLLGDQVRELFGLRSVFLIVSVLSGLAALLVALFAHEEKGLRDTLQTWSPGSVITDAVRDLRELLANPRVRGAVVLLFCLQFGIGCTNPLLELFVGDVTAADPERVSRLTALLFTAFAGAAVFASPTWGWWGDRVGHRKVLLLTTVLSALVLGAHAATQVFLVLLGARILLGFFAGGSGASAFAIAATESTAEHRGSAFGAVFSARTMAMAAGAVSGGAFSAVLGIPGLFVTTGALVLGALLLLRLWR